MTRNIRSILAVGAILLAGAALSAQTPPATGFVIRIPSEIAPETVTINVDVSSTDPEGGSIYEIRTRVGTYDYPVDVEHARALKVLVYLPRYQIVAQAFTDADFHGTIFVPPLVKLPSIRLEGRLVDSSNRPLPHQTVGVSYSLTAAMAYFGYMDGRVPDIPLGNIRTDDAGAFGFDLPSLTDDPLLQQYAPRYSGQFDLHIDGKLSESDDTLQPDILKVQRVYERPFVIVRQSKGILSGALGKDFLEKNGLPGDLAGYLFGTFLPEVSTTPAPATRPAISIGLNAFSLDGRVQYNAMLKADGTFEVRLPAGTYDLKLLVLGPGPEFHLDKTIVVESGVVVPEGARHVVQVP